MQRRKRPRGFTLIELMVVVIIMGVLSAIAVPSFVRLSQRSDRSLSEAAAQADQDKNSLAVLERQAPAAGPDLPAYESADIAITLSASQRRYGSQVYTRTAAQVHGAFTLSGRSAKPARLDFPFPLGTTEARDVFLYFLTPGAKLKAQDAVYDRAGIHWSGTPGRLALETDYVASGGGRFIYRLPPASRLRRLTITMDLSGVPAFTVPDHALQPTSVDGRRLTWSAGNLVSDRPIIVDIPEAGSPISRVFLLFRSVGAAVLLFGAGFWYLCELYLPGRTKTFHWGDFLLLASTYCLFFLNFAVLGLKGQVGTPAAVALAAALSLPLLALHVSRIVDWRFALSRAVPLGAFTLGLMVNAVYGGDAREYVFLAGALLTVAFLTATYPDARPKLVKSAA